MNDKRMKAALENLARRGVPENTNLWPELAAKIERKSPMNTLRSRPLLAVLIALFVLLALSGVAYALGRALGYIPGVGVVDQSTPVRVLAEPVTVINAGMTVTVTRVIADSVRTFISYGAAGIPVDKHGFPVCTLLPELRLPDGSKLDTFEGSSGGTGAQRDGGSISYEENLTFVPIPPGVDHVVFVFSCNSSNGDVTAFEIPIDLVAAPSRFATPVTELAISTQSADNKSGLSLEKVLELSDSYVLIGKFTDAGDLSAPLNISTSSVFDYTPRIEDANGTPVYFMVREDLIPEPIWDVAYYWAYEIPKPVAAPLTITLDHVDVRKYASGQFQFDAGSQPQAGQEWEFDQTVQVGGYTFTVEKIIFLGDGYEIDLRYESLPENVIFWAQLIDDPANPFQFDSSNATENHAGSKVLHTIKLTTSNPPPTGNLIIDLQLDESVPQPGLWTLTWSPPEKP